MGHSDLLHITTSIYSCPSCTTIIWKKFTIINNKPLQDIKQVHLKMTIAHIFLTHENFTSQKWLRINRSNGQWIWGLSHFVIVWILQKSNNCYQHMIMPYINIDKFSICMLSYLLKQLEHTVLNFDSYSMFNYILFFISFMKIINVSLGMMNLLCSCRQNKFVSLCTIISPLFWPYFYPFTRQY